MECISRGEEHTNEGKQSIHLSILGLLSQMKSKFEASPKLVTQSRAFILTSIKPNRGNASVPADISDKYSVLQWEVIELEHECEMIEQQRLFPLTFTASHVL